MRGWKVGDRVEFADDEHGSQFETGIVWNLHPIVCIERH
jgi:hypothetical protein